MDFYEVIGARRTIRDFSDQPIEMDTIKKIISAGLKAPTNDHLRSWEFVIVNDKEIRAELLKTIHETAPTSVLDVISWLDSWGSTDDLQRRTYIDAVPKQYAMLYSAGCLILPFFRHSGAFLQPETISSLNSFASILNMVLH